MKIFKHGHHRLFEADEETAKIVSDMLLDLERNGMDAVRKYSSHFDNWSPESFELSPQQIDEAIAQGYLIECDEYWQITQHGKLFLNSLLELFLAE